MNGRTRTLLLAVVFASACSAEPPAAPAAPSVADADAPPAAGIADPGAASPAHASADADDGAITALCLDLIPTYGRETCACGTKSFLASNEAAGTYAAMATHYLEKTDPEAPVEDRWNEAIAAVLTGTREARLELSNELGKAHLEATEGCND